jgi:hypothetical protein
MTDMTQRLIATFKAGPLSRWTTDQIAVDKYMRFAEAYVAMAGAKYRPAAPGDGYGSINLTDEQMADPDVLAAEAVRYAVRFGREDDECMFNLGCTDYATNRASVFAIEAVRLLAGGTDGQPYALKLLSLATREIRQAKTRKEHPRSYVA